tara:strand:+ start:61 stop:741 length:681 start_codon:yes stop_codon:yes gene_type:complete
MHLLSQFPRIKFQLNSLVGTKGQSLAEFAVITAMMATFVMTALPKFSDVMESGKGNKSIDEMDKILLQAKNFYEVTSSLEGRGRLPGQDKFDMPVGNYSTIEDALQDLETFTTYTDEIGEKWRSVFGTDNPLALKPELALIEDDNRIPDYDEDGIQTCSNCPEAREKGADEWLELFSEEPLVSPFQDGHFVYIVIPGKSSGENVKAPQIVVADIENAHVLHKVMDL